MSYKRLQLWRRTIRETIGLTSRHLCCYPLMKVDKMTLTVHCLLTSWGQSTSCKCLSIEVSGHSETRWLNKCKSVMTASKWSIKMSWPAESKRMATVRPTDSVTDALVVSRLTIMRSNLARSRFLNAVVTVMEADCPLKWSMRSQIKRRACTLLMWLPLILIQRRRTTALSKQEWSQASTQMLKCRLHVSLDVAILRT